MSSAAEIHDRMVAAYDEQQERLVDRVPGQDVWTGRLANVFRDNPRRPLDPILEAIAAHVRDTDVLVDAGGGAGRMSLPLALRCREVINVDPSEGMREVFESVKAEAGIDNARFLQGAWTEAGEIEGDVVLNAHVTYFVPATRPFIEKLVASARRRVIMQIHSVPPPNSGADLFEMQRGEAQALVPGHRQLIPVLWEMGILPDIQVIQARLPGRRTVSSLTGKQRLSRSSQPARAP
jgi:hypothetical protein